MNRLSMRCILLLLTRVLSLLACMCAGSLNAQSLGNPCAAAASYHIVVLGSSTAAGSGPSSPDSAWVNRYRTHLQQLNPANTVTNLAVGGFTTYRIMPTGYTPPPGRPSPDVTHNITHALSLNPDAIIINMPSNDVSSGFSVAEQLHNFDTIIDIATAANVPVWISTTQPKNYGSQVSINMQIEVRDSIFARYGSHAIDFWTTIATPAGTIDPLYDSGDGTHLNNAGHRILNDRVIAKSIPDSLFTPALDVDLAAQSLELVYLPACGDSQSIFRLFAANFGAPATSLASISLHWENTSTTQQGLLNATIAALATCTQDSADFTFNTATAGDYFLTAWITDPADSNASNDTVHWTFSSLGLPTLFPVGDTTCDTVPVLLAALIDPQDTCFWYDAPIAGNLVGTGPNFLTPPLSITTTYYAEAVRGHLYYSDALFTTSTSNVNWNGAMIDLIAQASLEIDSFAIKINSLGTQTVGIYTKAGTHIGFQTNSAAWTALGTATVQVNSNSSLTSIPLGGIQMNAGDTLGVYAYLQNTAANLSYQSLSQPQTYTDSLLTVVAGSGVSTGFSASYYPRNLNLSIHYHHGSRPGGDCSTGRIPVQAVLSTVQVVLPPDTIIDVQDSLLLAVGTGFAQYTWSTGDSSPSIWLTGTSLGTGIHVITLMVTDSLGCTGSDTIIVGVAYLLGSSQSQAAFPTIGPNPASTFIRIVWRDHPEPGMVRLCDAQGLPFKQWQLDPQQQVSTLDISDVAMGVYVLEWSSGNMRGMRRCAILR